MSPSAKTEPNECSRPRRRGIKVLVWKEPSKCHRAHRIRFQEFVEKFHENDPLEPEFSLKPRWHPSIATLRQCPRGGLSHPVIECVWSGKISSLEISRGEGEAPSPYSLETARSAGALVRQAERLIELLQSWHPFWSVSCFRLSDERCLIPSVLHLQATWLTTTRSCYRPSDYFVVGVTIR
jgi:hypothetical protein